MKSGSTFNIEVTPKIPRKMARLEELANNLWYSWDKPTRTLFARLHPNLWGVVGRNPRVFLRRIDEQRLVDAVDDQVFLATYNRVLSAYDTYHSEPMMRHLTKLSWGRLSRSGTAPTLAKSRQKRLSFCN